MTFSSREHAGRQLGQALVSRGIQVDLVLGLPRGGVVVAAEVARYLGRPLDVLVVRKIGHPRHREFAVGALAEPGVVVSDKDVLAETHVGRAELQRVIREETERLHSYQAKFHPSGPPELAGKSVLIVDDGLATGATAEAAVAAARERHAARVTVAVPVASPNAVDRLSRAADEVIALLVDPDFMAVGQYYYSFPQTTDEQVLALLPAHA
jgi:putative phosphoribosyl transferase